MPWLGFLCSSSRWANAILLAHLTKKGLVQKGMFSRYRDFYQKKIRWQWIPTLLRPHLFTETVPTSAVLCNVTVWYPSISPKGFRITSLTMAQSIDYTSAGEANLKNIDIMNLHNQIKANHTKQSEHFMEHTLCNRPEPGLRNKYSHLWKNISISHTLYDDPEPGFKNKYCHLWKNIFIYVTGSISNICHFNESHHSKSSPCQH